MHTVTLTQPYCIGRFEVTQAQWCSKMATNPPRIHESERPGSGCTGDEPPRRAGLVGDDPDLSRRHGIAVANRGGTGVRVQGGDHHGLSLDAGVPQGTNDSEQVGAIAWWSICVTGGNASGQTHSVGQKGANALGIHAMSGNAG